MKLEDYELPSRKPQTRRKTPKLIPLIALAFVLTIIPLYYPYSQKKLSFSSNIGYQHFENTIVTTTPLDPPPKPNNPPPYQKPNTRQRHHSDTTAEEPEESEAKSPGPAQTDLENTSPLASNNSNPRVIKPKVSYDETCDLFSGEWVPNPEGPYYTNATCDAIQEHQNCMKYGRPDTGFLKWRWKPDNCELPIFDPHKFLEIVRGKSLAFVGDSVARNHMQSLICLLSRVAHPVDASVNPTAENRLYQYTQYNFNISIISSPYLIKTEKTEPNYFTRPYHLFLDEPDETWTAKISTFDYIIISAGHWFFRPTYFYLNHTLIGCLYCPESNITHLTSYFSYRRAFQTAFRAINDVVDFKGVAFLRTFAPSHFEGGPWDKGGDCVRTRPFRRNETALEDYSSEMYKVQLEELRTAQRAGGRTGGKFRLLDATKPMLLRADGHPSKYGHRPVANRTTPNDCVHWCLPGPIDTWNDFLQELLIREGGSYNTKL